MLQFNRVGLRNIQQPCPSGKASLLVTKAMKLHVDLISPITAMWFLKSIVAKL